MLYNIYVCFKYYNEKIFINGTYVYAKLKYNKFEPGCILSKISCKLN